MTALELYADAFGCFGKMTALEPNANASVETAVFNFWSMNEEQIKAEISKCHLIR